MPVFIAVEPPGVNILATGRIVLEPTAKMPQCPTCAPVPCENIPTADAGKYSKLPVDPAFDVPPVQNIPHRRPSVSAAGLPVSLGSRENKPPIEDAPVVDKL
jgi:hypothetical protein